MIPKNIELTAGIIVIGSEDGYKDKQVYIKLKNGEHGRYFNPKTGSTLPEYVIIKSFNLAWFSLGDYVKSDITNSIYSIKDVTVYMDEYKLRVDLENTTTGEGVGELLPFFEVLERFELTDWY